MLNNDAKELRLLVHVNDAKELRLLVHAQTSFTKMSAVPEKRAFILAPARDWSWRFPIFVDLSLRKRLLYSGYIAISRNEHGNF